MSSYEETSTPASDTSSAVVIRRYREGCPFNIPSCEGCRDPRRPMREDLKLLHRKAFRQAVTAPSIEGIHSPAVLWDQIHQAFMQSYLSFRINNSYTQYNNIYHGLAPKTKLMNASRDALYLIHLGSRHHDERLLIQGRSRYSAALGLLREAIQTPDVVTSDSMLGAGYTMAQCEVFRAISEHSKGWQAHMSGLFSLFEHRGPKSITSPFALALLHNVRQATVMEGLLKRRGNGLFTSPGWIAAAEQRSTFSTRLTTTALAIGGVLERADILLARKRRKENEVLEVLADLVHLEGELNGWLTQFYELSGGSQAPYQLVGVSNYRSFRERCGIAAFVFPKVIDFPSFISATTHAYIWVCLLPVRDAIVQIVKLHPYPLLRPTNQDVILAKAADETADNLCRSVAYLSSTESSSAGVLSCGGPLYFAFAWYKRRQNREKLSWCDVVRRFLQEDEAMNTVFETALNLQNPILTWWMLPDIFVDPKDGDK